MRSNRTYNLNVSIGVAIGIVIYQFLFESVFDFYRPAFIGLFTFVALSVLSAFNSSDSDDSSEFEAAEIEQDSPFEGLRGWLWNVLVAIDQLGNTIAGGKPDITISARVGYFSNHSGNAKFMFYWKNLEWVINFTFYPLDGSDHCLKALEEDNENGHVHGNDLMRAILGIIIIVACFFIAIITWSAYFFGLRPQSQKPKSEN